MYLLKKKNHVSGPALFKPHVVQGSTVPVDQCMKYW